MRSPRWLPGLVVSAWLLASPAFAFAFSDTETGPAQLVADLAPGSISSRTSHPISGFTRLGSRSLFFRADSNADLWITDGTAEGTSPLGSLCCGYAEPLGTNGNVAFYRVSAWSPDFETAIWRTDGTPAGTFPLTESLPVPSEPDSEPLTAASIQGGLLYFTACTAELGCELWASDGSLAGTGPAGEIVPGPASAGIERLAATGDRAFLIVNVPGEPAALWVADGRTLRRLATAPGARDLAADAGRAFFIAEANGLEVWTSDGTAAGTRPVTAFAPRDPFRQPPYPRPFLNLLGGRAWFLADDGIHGFELWSAGIPQGLRRVSNLRNRLWDLEDIGKTGDRIVFLESSQDGMRLWSSRGDLRSTAPLAGCPGGCPVPGSPLAPLDPRRIVFYGYDRQGGGIWVTDGTGAGTRLIERTLGYSYSLAVPLDGRALIVTNDEYSDSQLWITDGTAAGTRFVTTGGPHWSHYWGWVGELEGGMANGVAVFPGMTDEPWAETLWRSDGSAAGSRPLLDSRIPSSTAFYDLTPLRDGLFVQTCVFQEDEPDVTPELRFVRGTETTLLLPPAPGPCPDPAVGLGDVAVFLRDHSLWRTDGTPAGTAALIPGSEARWPAALARFGDEAAIWLLMPDPTFHSELWLTDGTREGTRKQLALPDVATMYGLTAAGGRLLFFNAVVSSPGVQPWVSDGTLAGTHALTSAIGQMGDERFVESEGRIYFLFGEREGPMEIWATDGTAAGTGPAVTAASGAAAPQSFIAAGGSLYFAAPRASDPDGPFLPWVSHGTDGSTELLAGVEMPQEPFDRSTFAELDGRVFFAGFEPGHGDELWSTDGTPEGTARLLDIAPGLLGSYPRELTAWNGRLWFRARDAVHGLELWTTDGTAEGTRLVQDIAPGASWSYPAEMIATEEALYFTADDVEHGRELWVLYPF
ncbi:MAG: ELWxxDGT repeat protein [Thermoanaerobaculia bacterium]